MLPVRVKTRLWYRASKQVCRVSRLAGARLSSTVTAPDVKLSETQPGASPATDDLPGLLRQAKSTFPDSGGLHSRIDLALAESVVTRVAVIPFSSSRLEIKGLLEAIVADPLSSDQAWFRSFQNRLLSKDVLVKWGHFDYVSNHNSLVEFPIPFRTTSAARSTSQPQATDVTDRRNTQILEANSFFDSFDQIRNCHLHVFVSASLNDGLGKDLPSDYPSVLVLDLPQAAIQLVASETSKGGKSLGGGSILVSSELALDASEDIITSAANVSRYLSKWKASNISALDDVIFPSVPVRDKLLISSIISTCDKLVSTSAALREGEHIAAETEDAQSMRKQWSEEAHRELQTTLADNLEVLQRSQLPWWKLYGKVDDIYDISTRTLQLSFLPLSRSNLEYCLGRIDSRASELYGSVPEKSVANGLIEKEEQKLEAKEAVELHNTGLKVLGTALFGIQLPLTILPLLGIYFFDYSEYSMGSIVALGVVSGFRYLQKGWSKALLSFTTAVKESARRVLNSGEGVIWEAFEKKVLHQQLAIAERAHLVKKMQSALDKTKP